MPRLIFHDPAKAVLSGVEPASGEDEVVPHEHNRTTATTATRVRRISSPRA